MWVQIKGLEQLLFSFKNIKTVSAKNQINRFSLRLVSRALSPFHSSTHNAGWVFASHCRTQRDLNSWSFCTVSSPIYCTSRQASAVKKSPTSFPRFGLCAHRRLCCHWCGEGGDCEQAQWAAERSWPSCEQHAGNGERHLTPKGTQDSPNDFKMTWNRFPLLCDVHCTSIKKIFFSFFPFRTTIRLNCMYVLVC